MKARRLTLVWAVLSAGCAAPGGDLGGATGGAASAGSGAGGGAGSGGGDLSPTEPNPPAPGIWITVQQGSYLAGAAADDTCNTSVNQMLHSVTLSHDFELSATEVTFAEYEAATGAPHPGTAACPTCPVNLMSWHGAARLCNAYSEKAGLTPCYTCEGFGAQVVCKEAIAPYACHGYRLPTEAEWEYAYRAGTTTATHAGPLTVCGSLDPTLDSIAWFLYNSAGGSHPVAGKQPNAWGFFDMTGNVWEWAHDGYVTDRSTLPTLDPLGTTSENVRVMRGGSYNCVPSEVRAAHRSGLPATISGLNVGVRCARTRG